MSNKTIEELEAVIKRPGFVWEAQSVDGVTYPFSTNYYRMDDDRKSEVRADVNGFDDERERLIARHVISVLKTGDNYGRATNYSAIGRIICQQIIDYAEKVEAVDDTDLLKVAFFSGQPAFPNTGGE
jgi:hypothetical protein